MALIATPTLYDKNYSALIKEAINRIKANCPEFTALLPSDPGIAILDAMIYQLHQLGVNLNQLPKASLISWLDYLGVSLKLPSYAVCNIRITLEEALSEQYIIPKNTRFLTVNGIGFLSKSEAIINSGETYVDIECICETPGLAGNVKKHTITSAYQFLPYVKDIDNPDDATGGYDGEINDEALERGRKIFSHRYRAVTLLDYEQLACEIAGIGRAKAIDSLGKVDLYLLDVQGEIVNSELIKQVKDYLLTCKIAGIELNVHPAEFADITINANVKFLTGYNINETKQLAFQNIAQFYHPLTYQWGRSIYLSEIFKLIEDTAGIDYVESLVLPESNIEISPHQLPLIKEVNLNAI